MQNSALDAAYRATAYRVETPAGYFELRVAEPLPPAFADWLNAQGFSFWGVVTAYNPASQFYPDTVNRQASIALFEAAKNAGWRCFPACNFADAGDWPLEPGWLLLGRAGERGEADLCALACRFSQAAVLCAATGELPRLRWLAPGFSGV